MARKPIVVTREYHRDLDPRFRNYGYHNKEPVPLLAFRKGCSSLDLSLRSNITFASVGHLVAQAFGVEREFVRRCGSEVYFS